MPKLDPLRGEGSKAALAAEPNEGAQWQQSLPGDQLRLRIV